MSFEQPPSPESEQNALEKERLELFFEHYLARNPALDDAQRAQVKKFMLEHSSKAWGQYDDADVYPSSVTVESDQLVMIFDVMGTAVEERIPLSE